MTNSENELLASACAAFLREYPKAPIKLYYAINKCLPAIQKALETYQDTRVKLCERYCDTDGQGGLVFEYKNLKGDNVLPESEGALKTYKISDENKEKFEAELEEIRQMNVDLPVHKVKIEDLNFDVDAQKVPYLSVFLDYFCD